MLTPKNEKIEIIFNDQIYIISIVPISEKLSINIEEKTSFGIVYYNSYSKEELSSISSFFNMFSSLSDMIPSLLSMIKSKQFSISQSSDDLILEICPKIEMVKNLTFTLKQKELDNNELIKKLIIIIRS